MNLDPGEIESPSRIPASSVREERILKGIGVSPGIAIGPAYVYTRELFTVVKRKLDEAEIAAELDRFEQAVVRSERELKKIASVARERLGDSSASIFEAQALMLRDDALYDAVVERIQEDNCNADFAVHSVMTRHRQSMVGSENEYLRERANDLLDVQDRIIRHLRRGKILSSIEGDKIVISENLTAADIILFSRRSILGCATEFGGATSHVSIVARALNVPAVVSLHGVTGHVEDGDIVVLDGLKGRVIVNPTPETLAYCRMQQERYSRFLQEQKHLAPLPAETLDRHRIKLRSNLEFKEELELLAEFGAEGVGLFRTEILFLMQGRISFTEDEQFDLYRMIVEKVGKAGTTFRVLDLGGDKVLPLAHREDNPFLGWRGIRLLLEKPDLLIPQLRAILRASAFGPLRIMLPMITNVSELRQMRQVIEQVKEQLSREGADFDPEVPVGIMVEVPSVALMADRFADESDFFSIGSNDLTQYVLAVDRGNDQVSGLYDELHPAVLSLIKMTVDAARRRGIPVSLCGEVAANPRAAAILLGLGLDELSVAPRMLPEVKRVIRSVNYWEAQELARNAVNACTPDEVHQLTEEWFTVHGCDPNLLLDS